MDILSYVQELLQKQKTVSIKELGTFYKKKFAGRFDKVKKSFIPPSYILQFTSTEDPDFDLTKNLVDEKNIDPIDAQNFVTAFVNNITTKLEIEHEAILPSIGKLYFTEHEGLSFDPEKNVNLGSEFFGLPEVINPDVETEVNLEEIYIIHQEIEEAPIPSDFEETIDNQPIEIENIVLDEVEYEIKDQLIHSEIVKLSVEDEKDRKSYFSLETNENTEIETLPETVVNTPIDQTPFYNSNSELHEASNSKSIWTKIATILFLLLIAGLVLYIFKPELFKGEVKNLPYVDPIEAVITDTLKNEVDSVLIKKDSIAKTDSILKAHNVKQVVVDTAVKTKPIVKTTNITLPETYEVIAASFKTQAKAEIFVEQMKAFDINAKIISLPDRKLKKISVASFKTEKEAYEKKPELAKKIKIKELDIIKVNPNL